jgi:spore coat polysaccharide biosynthesis predicted glycosyltransferase SpsG
VGLVIADNQIKVAESLHSIGLGESFDCRMPDWIQKVVYAVQQLFKDETKRNLISLNGQKLVDGMGAQRVALLIKQLFN